MSVIGRVTLSGVASLEKVGEVGYLELIDLPSM